MSPTEASQPALPFQRQWLLFILNASLSLVLSSVSLSVSSGVADFSSPTGTDPRPPTSVGKGSDGRLFFLLQGGH